MTELKTLTDLGSNAELAAAAEHTRREPTWAEECRRCIKLRQTHGGRIWKCEALFANWRMGYAADARKPGGVCGPDGKAFEAADLK